MKNQTMSLKIPQTTMKTKSFTSKSCKGEWKVTNVGLGFKTKTWVITCKDNKVSFNFPEIKMVTFSLVINVPECKNSKIRFSFDVPEFNLVSPIPDENKYRKIEEQTEELTTQANTLSLNSANLEADQKQESKTGIQELFVCITSELIKQREDIAMQFESNIEQMNKGIDELRANGQDPSNIKTDDGLVINLFNEIEKLRLQEKETLDNIDYALSQLPNEEDTAIRALSTPGI